MKRKHRRKWTDGIPSLEQPAKQSGRGMIPEVLPVMKFLEALQFAKDLDLNLSLMRRQAALRTRNSGSRKIRPGQSIGIFIGPEGGFEEAEVEMAKEMQAIPVTLGRRILRTETAGMTMLSILVCIIWKAIHNVIMRRSIKEGIMEVYLDNSATTRCYKEVGELVYKVMCQDYGNPSRCTANKSMTTLYQRRKRDTGKDFKSTGKRDLFYIRRNRK